MRFSAWPINQQPLADIVELCRHVESTGWDGVWMADHLMPARPPLDAPVVECWTAMTAIALQVPRLRVGSLVLSNTFRHPAVVAKMAATLESLVPDRLVLGLGAGWQVNEHDALGLELAAPGPRLRRLDEACTLIRELLDSGASSFAGSAYELRDAVVAPVPRRHVPLLLGMKGERALRLAARHADEWNMWSTPELFVERSAVLDRHCAELGRDPRTISRSTQAIVCFTDHQPLDPRWQQGVQPLLTGSSAEMADRLEAYRQAGVDEFVVPDFALGSGSQRSDAYDRFITEVASQFR